MAILPKVGFGDELEIVIDELTGKSKTKTEKMEEMMRGPGSAQKQPSKLVNHMNDAGDRELTANNVIGAFDSLATNPNRSHRSLQRRETDVQSSEIIKTSRVESQKSLSTLAKTGIHLTEREREVLFVPYWWDS